LPNITRRPLPRSTAASSIRPSKRPPSPSTERASSASERCPRGSRDSASRRTTAPPGVIALSPTAATGAAARPPTESPARTARSASPRRWPFSDSGSSTGGCSGSRPRRDAGSVPATSAAATIEPAEVPT
jgi:hypothetical protein